VSVDSITRQLAQGFELVSKDSDEDAAYALIIDGKALIYALADDMKHLFLRLAVLCASVVCCRVSPKQKALVTTILVTNFLIWNFIYHFFNIFLQHRQKPKQNKTKQKMFKQSTC
jgi:magnesium-transporting ATPase (P-type)